MSQKSKRNYLGTSSTCNIGASVRYPTSNRPRTWIDRCKHVIVATWLQVTNRDNGTRIGRYEHMTVATQSPVTNRDNKTDRGIVSRLLVQRYSDKHGICPPMKSSLFSSFHDRSYSWLRSRSVSAEVPR
jgi:hypothetical protein